MNRWMLPLLGCLAWLGATTLSCDVVRNPAATTPQAEPIPEPSSPRGLVIQEKALTGEMALTAVGLRPEPGEGGERAWDHLCEHSRPISLENGWKQRFRVTIMNRGMEVTAFSVTVDQYGADQAQSGSRSLGRVLVPPLTEKSLSGYLLTQTLPEEILCRIEKDGSEEVTGNIGAPAPR
jgi:hypothetical protein